jgi:hypothetical protein
MDSEQQIFLYNLNIHMNGAQENHQSDQLYADSVLVGRTFVVKPTVKAK